MEIDKSNNKVIFSREESIALGKGAEGIICELTESSPLDIVSRRKRYFEQDPSSFSVGERQRYLSDGARFLPLLNSMQIQLIEVTESYGIAEAAESYLRDQS